MTKTSTTATFDRNDHALTAGYATYHQNRKGRRAVPPLVCRLFGHPRMAAPANPNGYSPSNYARCPRCKRWMHWFVVGQHRFGGMPRD